jgi:AcrR family transcriptional regulator
MASVVSREAYFETGLDVLSDLGYDGLKLTEVCNRLGVTTGSFYHYFSGWPAYTKELVAHWMQGRTVQVIEVVRAEPVRVGLRDFAEQAAGPAARRARFRPVRVGAGQ